MRRPADSHLTYIGAGGRRTTYDVYPRKGGLQLGTVEKAYSNAWIARKCEGGDAVMRRTRWAAAIILWPEGSV